MKRPVVAIDGPSGSGKSTTARGVAKALDLAVLDTGAMYRAVTLAVLEAGIDPGDDEAVARTCRAVDLATTPQGETLLNGRNVEREIRGPQVTAAVSAVAANPAVRASLVGRQRAWVDARGAGVVEGRDIGTVVFPDAAVKVFLVADANERARRRSVDERAADRAVAVDAVQEALARRDEADSTRAAAPLRVAEDAIELDTTSMSVDEVVAEIVDRYEREVSR